MEITPQLLIGCPIHAREWAYTKWYEAARISATLAGYKPDDIGFIYVLDRNDIEMKHYIQATTRDHRHFITTNQTCPSKERVWNETRYREMVYLRNSLLEGVRHIGPQIFLSLDSDILLHPLTIKNLIETLQGKDCAAVGGKTYMTERGVDYPSYANMIPSTGALLRSDTDGVIPVEVIMAIKLMSPEAYNVDYRYHDKGEDIGWSQAVRATGQKLIFDGRVASKHLMKPEMLDKVDARCGF